MLAAVNPTPLPALRIVATFFFIINLIGFAYIFRNRHRSFDRDLSIEGDEILSARRLRIEVIFMPCLTTLILILLIGFWLA